MSVRILTGDCRDVLSTLPAESVHCCVTSPPYFRQRDYLNDGQMGHELSPILFAEALTEAMGEVHRVLRNDGCVWLNIGDTYAAGGNGGGGSLVAKRRQWTGADGRHRMNADTQALLAYIVGNPGVPGDVLRSVFGGNRRLKKRLDNLAQCLNVYTVKTGARTRDRSYFPTRGGAAIAQGRTEYMPRELRAQPHCEAVVPARDRSFEPWLEPYLPDWHIRRDGLEYRNCASLRNGQRVFCYSRPTLH